ncbi:MAG: HAD family phosphatase [Dermatophilaceae bacterium]
MSTGRSTAALPAAVLWDVDGTLLDTEPYWIAEEYAVVEALGGRWTHEDAMALVGQPLLASGEYMAGLVPTPVAAVDIVDRLVAGVGRRMQQALPWRPGAVELLGELRELGVPCGAVTMTYRVLTDMLEAALPAGALAVVVTGDEVTHGKPHPEPYATAARLLGCAPADCVAIEDSDTGAASALAAGMPTVVVPHVKPVPPLPGAVQVSTLVGVRAHDLLPLTDSARAALTTRG